MFVCEYQGQRRRFLSEITLVGTVSEIYTGHFKKLYTDWERLSQSVEILISKITVIYCKVQG